jgi:hypothetical protein
VDYESIARKRIVFALGKKRPGLLQACTTFL